MATDPARITTPERTAEDADAALRPNKVFSISLDHPVLDTKRWRPVMDVVREQLLTPVGLRSLGPRHPDYKARYYGDLRAREDRPLRSRSGDDDVGRGEQRGDVFPSRRASADRRGERVSQGASRTASERDFEECAEHLRRVDDGLDQIGLRRGLRH